MLHAQKKVGETPLELLDRLRIEHSELQGEILSYAGRLDPMAEGEMLILVGPEENKERETYLHFDKVYTATFLSGVATDTGDALGLITATQDSRPTQKLLEKEVANLTKLQQQTYPWFSGKTVDGIKLFDHFKAGNTGITRPVQDISIKKSLLLSDEECSVENIQTYIQESIVKVRGDFRQEDILKKWKDFFNSKKTDCYTFEVSLDVSAGTFIRTLTEHFSVPTTLLKLKRTQIKIK